METIKVVEEPRAHGRRRIRTCSGLGCIYHTQPIWAEHRYCPSCGRQSVPWPIVAPQWLEEYEAPAVQP